MEEEQIVLLPQEIEFAATDLWHLDGEEKAKFMDNWENLTGYHKRYIRRWFRFGDYKVIQEVEWASHCPLQAQPGDRIVYSGMGIILAQECSFGGRKSHGYCTWAVGSVLPFVYQVSDAILRGLEDISPKGLDHVKCMDMEPCEGGTGEVLFKVYCIKEKVTTPRYFEQKGIPILTTTDHREKYVENR